MKWAAAKVVEAGDRRRYLGTKRAATTKVAEAAGGEHGAGRSSYTEVAGPACNEGVGSSNRGGAGFRR